MTRNKPTILYEGTPCALSQKTNRYTKQTDTVNHIIYDAKLFIAPELEIPAGCEITVTRYGREPREKGRRGNESADAPTALSHAGSAKRNFRRVLKYVSAGEPFVYATHQESMLLRKDKA